MKSFKLWQLGLALVVVANLLYFAQGFISSVITLGVFLVVPGYLALRLIAREIKSGWEALSFSLGLSVLIMMLGGLVLNSMHALGLRHPLTTWNIFLTLDAITLTLLLFNRRLTVALPKRLLWPTKEQVVVFTALTLLPFLAIGGAISLNNGTSNVLIMILFGLIATLFLILILRKNLQPLYPYAIIMMGLAVLFTTSLRGWFISGSDVQGEFYTFQLASNASYWNIGAFRNSYNACLSITILPVIIARITHIFAPYIYKVVFQTIFAVGLLPIYLLIKRLRDARTALIGGFIFISFPTFLNDMPSINRQEIAFIFFSLLLLASFLKISKGAKKVLIILSLFGLILSHYSSSYVTLGLLIASWVFYGILIPKKVHFSRQQLIPLLNLPIILIALLITFLWNTQITNTSAGLERTVTKTFQELLDHSSEQAESVSYSLLAPTTKTPNEILVNAAGTSADHITYVPQQNLPITKIGGLISKLVSVQTLNTLIRAFSARILQVLLILGVILLFLRNKKTNILQDSYILALSCGCTILLFLQTLLPQLSVDYGTLRFSQQALMILSISIIVGTEFLVGLFTKKKTLFVAGFFALLFLDLSGFIPQLLGGYPAQLALNNSGLDYQDYYVHRSDVIVGAWMSNNVHGKPIGMAQLSQTGIENYILSRKVTATSLFNANQPGYIYKDNSNIATGRYDVFLDGDRISYTLNGNIADDKDLIYATSGAQIYK